MANWWDTAPAATPLDIGLAQEGVTGPLADLARSIYEQESGSGRNTRTSNAGAVGGMQILPGTFREVADAGWDIGDPVANARAGIRYLGRMLETGGGDPRMAAIGYYGGPGAIRAAQAGRARSDPRNPNAPTTLQYADQVMARLLPAAQASTLPASAAPSGGNWWEAAAVVESPQPAAGGNWWEAAPPVGEKPEAVPGDVAPGAAAGEPTFDQRVRASIPGRVVQGMSDAVTGGAQLLVNSLPEPVVNAVNAGTQAINDIPVVGDLARLAGIRPATADQLNQAITDEERRYQEARRATGNEGFDFARMAGNIAGTAPLLAAAPGAATTALGRVGVGAAQGALMGGLQPVTQGPVAENTLYQMAMGGAAGGALAGVGQGISRLISPRASQNPQVQTLLDEGVTPTPGQLLGGTARTVEDRAMSVPILGDAIRGARNRGIEDLNRAALNRAVAPIGRTVTATGRDGMRQANNAISQAYDDLMPRLTFRADQQFAQEISNLQQMVQALPEERIGQFDRILRDKIVGRLTPQGVADGQNFKAMESELGRIASGLMRAADVDQRDLGMAVRELQSSLRSALERSNPQAAGELSRINQAYSLLTRLQTAAGGAGAADGVFTPAQLSAAVRSGDRSMRHAAFARGDALMQDLSDAAKGVMQGAVPNSGTVDRAALVGTIAGSIANPLLPVGLGAASLPYLPTVNRLAAMALARRPQAANRIAEAVSQGFIPAPLIAGPLANQVLGQ